MHVEPLPQWKTILVPVMLHGKEGANKRPAGRLPPGCHTLNFTPFHNIKVTQLLKFIPSGYPRPPMAA